MTFKNIYLLGAGIAALSTSPAFAQSISDEQAAALLNRLDALEQEVQSLRAQLQTVETEQKQTTEQVAAVAQAAPKDTNTVSWKGAPEIKGEGGWSFKPRGRILYDFASLSAPDGINIPGEGFTNEVRRARLGVSGTIPGGFGYKFEADISDGVEITDALIDYEAGNATITVGQHNNFQSLEELSSSNDTSFIERAAFTDAFGFERKIGVSVQYTAGDALIQAGVFTDNIDDLGSDGNDSINLDGRFVYAPKFGDTQLHLGASAHWRDLGDTIDTVRYRQRPLIHTVDTRFINTGNISDAEEETTYGLEAAVISGRFHAAGETHWAHVSRAVGPNPTFFGGAIEAGMFFTDDSREYKGGVFKGVKVNNPVSDGGWGALQFNIRYDRLDLNNDGIVGGIQNGYMASLIWTPVDYVRFLVNYGHLSYEDAAIVAGTSTDYSVDVIGARAQISF